MVNYFLLTNNKIPFGKNSYLGVDIIESVFDICDVKETEDGLSLTEVKEVHCMNYLVRVLGMLDENIEKDFKAIDENGDGLVSKEEGFKAYEKFALDRPPTGAWLPLNPKMMFDARPTHEQKQQAAKYLP